MEKNIWSKGLEVRGSQESNIDERILMRMFEGNFMSNYFSVLGSHMYIYYLH